MPIKNRIASQGGDPSYNMLHTDVSHNYFKANYGGAQGLVKDSHCHKRPNPQHFFTHLIIHTARTFSSSSFFLFP